MKKALLSLSVLGLFGLAASAASAADLGGPRPAAPAPVVVAEEKFPLAIFQLGPTTPYSTIQCADFAKLPDGSWKAIGARPFGLGFTQGIVPPVRPIKVGSYIYNNVDLYSQLELQCEAGSALVRARY